MLRIDSHIDQVNAKTLQCNGKADVGIPYAEQRSQSSYLNKLNEGRHRQTHKAKTTNVHPSSTTTPSYRSSNSLTSNNVKIEGVKASKPLAHSRNATTLALAHDWHLPLALASTRSRTAAATKVHHPQI
jgi:hypothetical protein